jgi:hypothetical protein
MLNKKQNKNKKKTQKNSGFLAKKKKREKGEEKGGSCRQPYAYYCIIVLCIVWTSMPERVSVYYFLER